MNAAHLLHDKHRLPQAFDRVAASYDRLTALNPGYRKHLRWSAKRLRVPPGGRVLDLCCGTGRSTEALLAVRPDARVTALDGSPRMLEVARRKGLGRSARLVCGDAMDPTAAGVEGPFDGILMAYGLRNMPDPDRCLARLQGLLRPGSWLCLHEYSVRGSVPRELVWNAVTLGVIVPGGLLTSGSTTLYRYLRRSVLEFDSVAALEARLRRAGLEAVHTEPMDGWQRGIVHSFLGRRPLGLG